MMMQQVMEMLVKMKAKADTDQEKRKANQAKMDTEMKTNQEMLAKMETKMDINLKKMTPTVGAFQEKMDAWIANMRDDQKGTMSSQVTTEACLDSKEPNLEDMESEVERQEASTEEATVKSSGTMMKWHRRWHLVAGRWGEPKELTQGDCGSKRNLAAACRKVSHCAAVVRRKGNVIRKFCTQGNFEPWKELATASRKITCCAGVAWHEGHRCKGENKDDVAPRCPKGRIFGKRCWKGLECNSAIRDRGIRQQLRGSK
jgi:hypothetical protein